MRKCHGHFHIGFVIQKGERLQGSVGARAADDAGSAVRGIKVDEAHTGCSAPPHDIHAAAETIFIRGATYLGAFRPT